MIRRFAALQNGYAKIRWPQKINTANYQNQKARAERLFSAICSGFFAAGQVHFYAGNISCSVPRPGSAGFYFAGGLLALFVLFIIMYMVGINQWVCIIFGVTSATLLVWQTFRLNEKYGTHGLMKLSARRSHPFHIINRKAISRLFHLKQASK